MLVVLCGGLPDALRRRGVRVYRARKLANGHVVLTNMIKMIKMIKMKMDGPRAGTENDTRVQSAPATTTSYEVIYVEGSCVVAIGRCR